jgi:hypothetical protein
MGEHSCERRTTARRGLRALPTPYNNLGDLTPLLRNVAGDGRIRPLRLIDPAF